MATDYKLIEAVRRLRAADLDMIATEHEAGTLSYTQHVKSLSRQKLTAGQLYFEDIEMDGRYFLPERVQMEIMQYMPQSNEVFTVEHKADARLRTLYEQLLVERNKSQDLYPEFAQLCRNKIRGFVILGTKSKVFLQQWACTLKPNGDLV